MIDTTDIQTFIRKLFRSSGKIPLHEPVFRGNEKQYLAACIDSTYVSYVGQYVTKFEEMARDYTGARFAVATVNGTAALHILLKLVGVTEGTEVLTQSTSFVATTNAIRYCGAVPAFIDVDADSWGLSPERLSDFLKKNIEIDPQGQAFNKVTRRPVIACVPMHTFGMPAKTEEIHGLCREHSIVMVEDAAEALGSRLNGRHVGHTGKAGILSFNGNKIVTTGGGGMVLTDDPELAAMVRHVTTTAKKPHTWEYVHDEIGFNYRMPNINAAVGCAQLEKIDEYLANKRVLADRYREYFNSIGVRFFSEYGDEVQSNYWLNAIVLNNRKERDLVLRDLNKAGITCRPLWKPLHSLEFNNDAYAESLEMTNWLYDRVVNIPSSAIQI